MLCTKTPRPLYRVLGPGEPGLEPTVSGDSGRGPPKPPLSPPWLRPNMSTSPNVQPRYSVLAVVFFSVLSASALPQLTIPKLLKPALPLLPDTSPVLLSPLSSHPHTHLPLLSSITRIIPSQSQCQRYLYPPAIRSTHPINYADHRYLLRLRQHPRPLRGVGLRSLRRSSKRDPRKARLQRSLHRRAADPGLRRPEFPRYDDLAAGQVQVRTVQRGTRSLRQGGRESGDWQVE